MLDKDWDSRLFSGKFMVQKALFVCVLTMVAGFAVSVPFVYHSMTLWYKVGADRVYLLAGQVVGMFALLFICLQLLAAVKPPYLLKIFGLSLLMHFHRANGTVIFLLALCHVLLVLGPEGFTNLPIGYKYWPEMVGGLLFTVISVLFISSRFREKLAFSYSSWRVVHKPLGYGVLALLFLHVRFVSDSFTHLVPEIGLYLLFFSVASALCWAKRDQSQVKKLTERDEPS